MHTYFVPENPIRAVSDTSETVYFYYEFTEYNYYYFVFQKPYESI